MRDTGASKLPDKPSSYWIESTPRTCYPVLEEDISTDVAIVGGGITGITTAMMLKAEGLKVVVLEADRIAKGTSGHTTAKITSQHSLIYDKLKKSFGEEKARQYADANETAIRIIKGFVEKNDIECDFCSKPAYIFTQRDGYVSKLEDEAKAASSLGIDAHFIDSLPLPFEVKAAVRFDGQAQFHPRKYLIALAKMVEGDGSHIFEQTRIVDLHEGKTCSLIAGNGKRISADKIVLASHYPFYDRHGLYFARLYPDRSYLLGVRMRGKFPDGMFINAEDPSRTMRSQPAKGGELVLIGGEHHKTGHGVDTMEHYKNCMEFAEQSFTVTDIPYRWSAQDYTTADEVPYIGHITSDRTSIYVATGFAKWGMTNGTVSACIIRDLITRGDSPWAPVYDPSRFTPAASARNIVVENADVAYNLVSGKLAKIDAGGHTAPDVGSDPGEKAEIELKCTHLGCELHWNHGEESWDCPCHGSRFTMEGAVMEGPALKPLDRKTENK